MTSRIHRNTAKDLTESDPKTPHEEIMFCIDSTNDIVSKILELLEKSKLDACKECTYYQDAMGE